ncbi:MAG: ABC transporter ATP-binding protein/permease, partial [Alphaproteobacteria bacterium]|nr:ABC transporter ATP-binding protein/permease [Alphaproteobacteria bacterium]
VWPLMQKWFIALFEGDIVLNHEFFMHGLHTVLLIVGIWFVFDCFWAIQMWARGHINPKINNQISEVLTNYVQSQSMAFWTSRMSGKVFAQIGYVATGFQVIEHFYRIFGILLFICINVVLLININFYLSIIFAFAFVVRGIYSWGMVKPLNKAAKQASDSNSSLSGHIIDSISNYYVVKLFAGRKREELYLKKPRQKRIQDSVFSAYMQRLFFIIPGFLWDICIGALLFACVVLFMRGEIKVSEIVFTIGVFLQIMGAINYIVFSIPDIVDKIGSATHAYKELVVPLDIVDKENAKSLKLKHGKIEFKNVSFKYKNKLVLRNLSFNVKAGEKVGIVGASGAGKTTLVNLLMRFYEPNKGEIYIDGQNINDVLQESLRENIAFIPQEPTMFNRSIKENIAYGKQGATDKEIHLAAKEAAADKFILSTEKKYDSMVGDRGIILSGGQKQRIAIARAFLKNAPILVLDEATSALDSETELSIQKSFDKLSKGRTTIAIAHRLSTLRNMDRIIVLDSGRVVEQGTHNSLIRKKGIYARLWKMQSGGFLQDESK